MPTIGTAVTSPLPAGGTAGQALGKTSSANGAAAWTGSPTGGGAGPVYSAGMGYWYDTRTLPLNLTNTSPTLGVNAGTAAVWPFYNAAAVQVNGLGVVNAGTTANSSVLMGFYTVNGFNPGSVIAATAATYSSGAALTATVPTFTLPAGWVFAAIGIAPGGSGGFAWVTNAAARSFFPLPNGPNQGGSPCYCIATSVGAALADNPSVTYVTSTSYSPVLFYRVA